MRAEVVTTPGSTDVIDVIDPTPMDHDAVVAVSVCGVCGTDVTFTTGTMA
jgi:D-arabinose 1-dehydrogenase-like Zn-dependent alcohol dehydrogenase